MSDSEKTIEAFRVAERCENGSGGIARDILYSPSQVEGFIHGADGTILRRSGMELGDKWYGYFLNYEGIGDNARECHAEIIGILFADGTYEGKLGVVRAMKAWRDGIRDSVSDWVKEFAHEVPANPNLEAIHAEAQKRADNDHTETNANDNPLGYDSETLLHSYWSGREQTDMCIEVWARPGVSHQTPTGQWKQLAYFIDNWQKKIAGNQAMKVLDAQFPPVSPGNPTGEVAPSAP